MLQYTAIFINLASCRALHLLHENPAVYQELEKELIETFPDRTHSILHAEVKDLPYLNATIWEVMRLRTVAGGSQRRIPPGGTVLCGVRIPEGVSFAYYSELEAHILIIVYCQYEVGSSTIAVHLSPEIYGEDAEIFRPARWLEADPEQLNQMRQSFLGFSMGTRSCIGQKYVIGDCLIHH